MRYALLAGCLLIASTNAQRIPDPVDNRREIQVYDARPILENLIAPEVLAEASGAEQRQTLIRDRLLGIATFVREFLEPTLEDPDDLQAIGNDLLVLRGLQEQHIALGQLLRHLQAGGHEHVIVECRVVTLSPADFADRVAPLLGGHEPAPSPRVLGTEESKAFEAVLQELEPPDQPFMLAVAPAAFASMAFYREVRYRRDVEVDRREGRAEPMPVMDKLQEGLFFEARAASLDESVLGVSLDAELSELQRPMATSRVEEPRTGKEVEIDLPELRTYAFAGQLRLPPDSLGVLAEGAGSRWPGADFFQRGDGIRLLLVRARRD